MCLAYLSLGDAIGIEQHLLLLSESSKAEHGWIGYVARASADLEAFGQLRYPWQRKQAQLSKGFHCQDLRSVCRDAECQVVPE